MNTTQNLSSFDHSASLPFIFFIAYSVDAREGHCNGCEERLLAVLGVALDDNGCSGHRRAAFADDYGMEAKDGGNCR